MQWTSSNIDLPKPVAVEDEVLIEVHACGMNNTDV